jgi:hypothetical protein
VNHLGLVSDGPINSAEVARHNRLSGNVGVDLKSIVYDSSSMIFRLKISGIALGEIIGGGLMGLRSGEMRSGYFLRTWTLKT